MASGEVITKVGSASGEEDRFDQVRTGWIRTTGRLKDTIVWLSRANDIVRSSLAKIRNESRLRGAYRDLGEFLFQRKDRQEIDEADQVELDLLVGKIVEIRTERDRLEGYSDRPDGTG